MEKSNYKISNLTYSFFFYLLFLSDLSIRGALSKHRRPLTYVTLDRISLWLDE